MFNGVKKCDNEVVIEATGQNLTLCVFLQDLSQEPIVKTTYTKLNVSVFDASNASENFNIDELKLKLVVGHVLGEPFSSLSGYVMNNSFFGSVYVKDNVHFLEPLQRTSRDLSIFGDGIATLLHTINGTKLERKFGQVGKDKRKLCDITIVSDHLFFHEIGGSSVHDTILQMMWHLKEANNLLMTKDFDDDGVSECIGITVSEITIFKSEESTVNLLTGDYNTPEDFLKRFSRYNFDGFCLGVLFTNRVFDDLVLGLSWRGNPKTEGVGGICQSRVRIKSDQNAYSFNALFISLKSEQESRIPLRMGVLNLLHELMHSFGSKHDPEPSESPECTPADKVKKSNLLTNPLHSNFCNCKT